MSTNSTFLLTIADDEKRQILLAMEEIQMSSCIRFVDHDPSNNGSDHLMIMKDYMDE